jgi:hypothetical protein
MSRHLIAALCALSTAAACEGRPDPDVADAGAVQTYVGTLADDAARVALVRSDAGFVAYVCGRGKTLLSHTHWFTSAGDAGEQQALSDGWRLRFSGQSGRALNGELETPDGERIAWSATLAQPGTEEGLYDANHAGCRDGIIVWKSEQGPGCQAQGSWCDAQGQRGQITPVVCEADQPLDVRGVVGGESFELQGERVVPP